jgi:hypothetical protein
LLALQCAGLLNHFQSQWRYRARASAFVKEHPDLETLVGQSIAKLKKDVAPRITDVVKFGSDLAQFGHFFGPERIALSSI